MKTNAAGINLIKSFESLRLRAYRDSAGVLTIGYGSTKGVKEGQRITAEEAEGLLARDLATAEAAVEKHVKVALSENQFSALVSLAFNIGTSAFGRSTLVRKLNRGDITGASNEFGKWVYAGGVRLRGLVRRRDAERKLFLT